MRSRASRRRALCAHCRRFWPLPSGLTLWSRYLVWCTQYTLSSFSEAIRHAFQTVPNLHEDHFLTLLPGKVFGAAKVPRLVEGRGGAVVADIVEGYVSQSKLADGLVRGKRTPDFLDYSRARMERL